MASNSKRSFTVSWSLFQNEPKQADQYPMWRTLHSHLLYKLMHNDFPLKPKVTWKECELLTPVNKHILILTCNLFLWCNAEFSASLSSVSHDPSEIILICWFAVQETFFLLLLSIFKQLSIFFQDYLMNRKIQRSAFIWNKKLFVTLYTIPFKSLESVYIYIYIFNIISINKIIEINTFI